MERATASRLTRANCAWCNICRRCVLHGGFHDVTLCGMSRFACVLRAKIRSTTRPFQWVWRLRLGTRKIAHDPLSPSAVAHAKANPLERGAGGTRAVAGAVIRAGPGVPTEALPTRSATLPSPKPFRAGKGGVQPSYQPIPEREHLEGRKTANPQGHTPSAL